MVRTRALGAQSFARAPLFKDGYLMRPWNYQNEACATMMTHATALSWRPDPPCTISKAPAINAHLNGRTAAQPHGERDPALLATATSPRSALGDFLRASCVPSPNGVDANRLGSVTRRRRSRASPHTRFGRLGNKRRVRVTASWQHEQRLCRPSEVFSRSPRETHQVQDTILDQAMGSRHFFLCTNPLFDSRHFGDSQLKCRRRQSQICCYAC
jgi:hypothetical protein